MTYILVHKTMDNEISKHFTVNKDAQWHMWREYDEAQKNAVNKVSGCHSGNWCEIKYSNNVEETWNIYPVDIPKTEKIQVTYKTDTEIIYFITKKELTMDNFFIYKYNTKESITTKLGKGNNPITLEQKYVNTKVL